MKPDDYKRVVSAFPMDDQLKNRIKAKIKTPVYKRIPIYRYSAIAACFIIVLGGVIAAINYNLTKSDLSPVIANSKKEDVTTSNRSNGSVIIAKASSQIPDSSPIISSTGSSLSSVKSSMNSSASASKGSTPSSTAATESAPPVVDGVCRNSNPPLLIYNNKIYSTPSTTAFIKSMMVNPGDVIGSIWGLKVCAVQGIDISKNICVQNRNSTGKALAEYVKYNYLCDNILTIKGFQYYLTVSYLNDSAVAGGSIQSQPNGSIAYTMELEDYPTGYDQIKDKVIGNISTGTIYSIDEIDPTNAVIIYANNYWFLVSKESGYTGKTISDVLKDKDTKEGIVN